MLQRDRRDADERGREALATRSLDAHYRPRERGCVLRGERLFSFSLRFPRDSEGTRDSGPLRYGAQSARAGSAGYRPSISRAGGGDNRLRGVPRDGRGRGRGVATPGAPAVVASASTLSRDVALVSRLDGRPPLAEASRRRAYGWPAEVQQGEAGVRSCRVRGRG